MKMLPALLRRIAIFTGLANPDFDDPKIPKEIVKNALASEKLQQRRPGGEELSYAPFFCSLSSKITNDL